MATTDNFYIKTVLPICKFTHLFYIRIRLLYLSSNIIGKSQIYDRRFGFQFERNSPCLWRMRLLKEHFHINLLEKNALMRRHFTRNAQPNNLKKVKQSVDWWSVFWQKKVFCTNSTTIIRTQKKCLFLCFVEKQVMELVELLKIMSMSF